MSIKRMLPMRKERTEEELARELGRAIKRCGYDQPVTGYADGVVFLTVPDTFPTADSCNSGPLILGLVLSEYSPGIWRLTRPSVDFVIMGYIPPGYMGSDYHQEMTFLPHELDTVLKWMVEISEGPTLRPPEWMEKNRWDSGYVYAWSEEAAYEYENKNKLLEERERETRGRF